MPWGVIIPVLLLLVVGAPAPAAAGQPRLSREELGSWGGHHDEDTSGKHQHDGGGGAERQKRGAAPEEDVEQPHREELIAVQVTGGRAGAEEVARRHGMAVVREVEGLGHQGYFLLRYASHRGKRDQEMAAPLTTADDVHWWEPQVRRKRAKRTYAPTRVVLGVASAEP